LARRLEAVITVKLASMKPEEIQQLIEDTLDELDDPRCESLGEGATDATECTRTS